MRIAVAFALALLLVPVSTNACSTFCLRDEGTVVYGRNYDFDVGTGVVLVNPRGVQKTSLPKLNSSTLSWTSKYGSVTFNQFGKDFPMDGMNEAGLVVALMWLDGEVTWTTDVTPARKSLRLGSLDLSCSSSVVALNVRSELTGDVVAQLSPYSHEANLAQMLDAYASSALLGEVSRSWIEQTAAHAQAFSCVPQRRQRAVRK